MEIEVKFELQAEGYAKFVEAHRIIDELDQWNIYFQDDAGYRGSLRLRAQRSAVSGETAWIFTIKGESQISGGVQRASEFEAIADEATALQVLRDPSQFYRRVPKTLQEAVPGLRGASFTIMGDMRTLRRIIQIGTLKVEADECFLPDGSKFFELEVETQGIGGIDAAQAVRGEVSAYLNSLGVGFQYSPTGKRSRLRKSTPRCSRPWPLGDSSSCAFWQVEDRGDGG